MIQSDWVGCYADNWKNEITPDAFAHPAKFSRGLIQRIYQHVIGELEGEMTRYATWSEAAAGHAAMVEWVKLAAGPATGAGEAGKE